MKDELRTQRKWIKRFSLPPNGSIRLDRFRRISTMLLNTKDCFESTKLERHILSDEKCMTSAETNTDERIGDPKRVRYALARGLTDEWLIRQIRDYKKANYYYKALFEEQLLPLVGKPLDQFTDEELERYTESAKEMLRENQTQTTGTQKT